MRIGPPAGAPAAPAAPAATGSAVAPLGEEDKFFVGQKIQAQDKEAKGWQDAVVRAVSTNGIKVHFNGLSHHVSDDAFTISSRFCLVNPERITIAAR